jgi:predicted TIM-barrel fold metal-dependent hydrolase
MILSVAAASIALQACHVKAGTAEEYYSPQDFVSVKKIDAHVHVHTTRPDIVQQARQDNFVLISLNCEVPGYPTIDSQQYYIIQQRLKFPKDIYYLSTFETATRNQPGWSARQVDYLKKSFANGALGIKVWKNIGMTIKDKDSNFIMIDDSLFDPIFNYLEQHHRPVCGHIGEPKACWLPYDRMTTNNDRSYFKSHPEYYMYLHPEYPSYEAIIRSRDHLLEKHPDLKFVGAHLGSMEWSVDEIAMRLDKFPNMAVDFAERIGHVQFQCIGEWQKVHDFFIKYQDRLIYGTDLEANESETPELIKSRAHELWERDWKFFVTGDTLESPLVNGRFKGMKLPKTIVDKLYYQNAEKWYLK